MEMVIFYTTFIPMGVMYLHARMFFTLADTTSIPYPWVQCIYCKNVLNTRSYDFYNRGCDIFTCKNVLNTRSYDFYTHGCDVFTCKNVLNTYTYMTSIPVGLMYLPRSYNLYICGCNLFTCKNILYTRSYNLYTFGCNVFTCKNVLYTL